MSQSKIQVTDDQVQQVEQLISASFDASLNELIDLVKTPGIAWDAFDEANLQKSAEQVAKLFTDTEVFDFVEIRRSSVNGKPGAPAILAKRVAKNSKPTFLLYAHHDVQPPGDESQWLTKPFEPVEKDGRLFGRGAADDKAGIVAHLAAIRVLKTMLADDFEVGITVFIEGEEEAGSPTFRNFLEENRADLAADVIIVADSGNLTTEIPSLTTTLRGLVSVVVEVTTLDHALHSGMYGGAVPDAMLALVKLLASLHDDVGNVVVAGLVSGQAAPIDYTDADLRRDSGLLAGVSQIGDGPILDRIWTKPAITVIGIDGQTVALASNTLLPTARAKISLRIAPGQHPNEALQLLKAHLIKNVPFGAKLSFGEVELGKPFEADLSNWASDLAKQALSAAWQVPSVDIGIGGSIPFIADLTEVFTEAQILVTGVEDPDSRAHSPNESVHLKSLQRAMVAESLLLLGGNVKTLP